MPPGKAVESTPSKSLIRLCQYFFILFQHAYFHHQQYKPPINISMLPNEPQCYYYKQILQLMRNQGNLQPTPKVLLISLACLFFLTIDTHAFTFSAATVSIADRQINAQTTYIISLMRSYDDSLNPTNWNSTPVPSSATATIIFPPEFAPSQLSAYSCDSILVNSNTVTGFSCARSGNTVTVSNLFTGSDLVSDVEITLGNIVNPFSALTTSPFIGTIGSDSSSGSVSADVTFTQGTLSALTISFKGGIVNRTSDLIISFTTANYVPSNGQLTIQFPATLIWARELSSNHLIPFNGTLTCYGLTPEISNSTIQCQGSYSTKIVTVSTFLSSTLLANKPVSLGILGLFAPPTTQPIDTLTVSTCDNNLNTIDTHFATISGLMAQALSPYTMQSSLATPMGVNNFAGGLTFSFGLTDTISFRDYFLITFPAGTTITFIQSTSTIRLLSTTYTSSNQSLVILQNTSNSNFVSGTQVNITFIRYRAPPSTRPSGSITFTVMNSGYAKMTASATITAIANNYTLSVSAASSVVNVYTSYTFSFTMSDALTSTGYFVLVLDPNLCVSNAQRTTITTNLTITVSGTNIRSSPSTQITPTTINGLSSYQLLLSNLNTSSSNIPVQSVIITVSNILNPSAVATLNTFTLSTYYSNSADLVANGNYTGSIVMQAGVITLNSITSTATTTYTFTTISIDFKITNPVSSNGYVMVTIPSDITLLSASKGFIHLSSTLLTSTYTNFVNNNTILLQVTPSLAAGSTITVKINNIMTQNTTKTTGTFVTSTFDSTFSAIDQSTNSMGLSVTSGNNFNSLTLARGSAVNSYATNYTITFEQIQSFTSVSVVSFKFNNYLSLSSLSRVFEVTSTSTVPCLFTKINSTYLQVTLTQTATSSHTIIIQKVTNPPSQAPLTLPILAITSTPNFLYIYSQMYTEDIVNTDPSSLTINSFTFSSYVFGEPTDLALSATTLTSWPSETYQLVINIPTQFDVSSATCSSNITSLGCSFFIPTRTLTVSMTSSAALPVNIIFSINSLLAPSFGTPSQAFILSTFDANGYAIQLDSTTVIFINNCSFNCRTCFASNKSACITCYSSSVSNLTLLHGQSCVSACPSISYQSNLACIDCSPQCLTCNFSSTNCSTCSNDTATQFYYFNASSDTATCLDSCSIGTYQINQTCLDCSDRCVSCNSIEYCFQCRSPYLYFNGSCLLACPNNTLTNSTNSSCTLCQSPCQSCQNVSSFCLTCIAGTVLFNNTCSTNCPLPNLFISANQTCDPCDSLCSTCFFEAANCTSCSLTSNFTHLYANTCLSACPQLYYSNLTTSICQACSSLDIGCSNCSSPTTCFSCDTGFSYLSGNQSCLNFTPTGYFSINGSLYACNSTCNSCLNTSFTCTSCIGNLNLYQNQCISACPTNLTVSTGNICQYCAYPCSTCLNSTSKCLSCALNSSLFHDASNFICVDSANCPNSTYSDNTAYRCSSCNSSCVLCSVSSTNCSKCSPSFYLLSSNNSCLMQCPDGTVKASSLEGGICQACAYPCLTCSGTPSLCLSCSQANSTLFLNSNGTCVDNSSCQVGAYANSTNYLCTSCVSPCSTCISVSQCLSCQKNFSLITSNYTCSNVCPTYFAPTVENGSSVCAPCNYPCSTCSSSIDNCTSCASNSSLYLQRDQCVNASSCQTGTYANQSSNVCQSCPVSCSSCNNLTNCSACSTGYYFDPRTNLCVSGNQCQNGTLSGYNSTSGRNECLSCSSPCQTCSINITLCTSCLQYNTSLFVLNYACVNATTCPNGTFADQAILACTTCTSPCSKCLNQTVCLSCVADYFLNGTNCLGLCPNGTYVSNQSGVIICSSCDSMCSTCSSQSSNCTSCSGDTYLFNNTCVNSSSCPSGTFSDATTNSCTNCTSPCGTCLNSTYCQSCYSNKSIDLTSGTCYSTCPNGTISMNVSGVGTCVACASRCSNCISSISFCSSCSNSSQLYYNGSCYDPSSCPNGTFSNNLNNTCVSCSPPCNFCSDISLCITCLPGFYLLNSTCLPECPNGTVGVNFSSSGICQVCASPCGTCKDSISNCTSCLQTGITLFFYNNSCYNVSSCPPKTYSDNTTLSCKACISPCFQCLNPSLCSSCISGFYFAQNNTCLSDCPLGTLAINLTLGGVCSVCTYPCLKCTGSLSNCTSCSQINQTFYLSNGSCVANTSCINGTYANASTLMCETCVSQCSTCLASQICTTCSPNFYLTNLTCMATCPNGTLGQNSSYGGSCQSCSYPCLTCSGALTHCLSCSQVNGTLYLLNGTCTTSSLCINGTYPNSTTLICQLCHSACSSCASLGACLTCSSGYYFYNMTCKTGCPNGTLAQNYTSGGLCQSCIYPCSQCVGSLSNCTTCSQSNSTLFLSNGECVSNASCLNGTYSNGTTLKCEVCVAQCSTCLSYSICNACNNGFYLNGTICGTTCPNRTVGDNGTRACVNCLSPCNFCTINQTNCLSCLNPFLYYQANNSCLSTCPDFYYANTTTLQCKSCLSPCSTCSSATSCLSCASGYYLFTNNSCLASCPSGYYNNNASSVCSVCTNNCNTCLSSTVCTSCSPPYLLDKDVCGTSCPLTALYNVSNTCKDCTSALAGCLSCNSTDLNNPICSICDSSLVLSQGKCQSPSSETQGTLTGSLKVSSIFPLPFTITGSIIFIACFMSKLQNKNSYVVGTAYSLFGFIQSACLVYTIIIYHIYVASNTVSIDYQVYLQAALLVIGALNIFGLFVQSYQLSQDQKFGKWTRSKCNFSCYVIVAILSCLFNYKFKMIIFTKLFSFYCLRAQLESVQKFKLFNIMSFLGVGHEGLVIYISAIIMTALPSKQQTFLSFLDLILVNVLNIGLALAVSSKDETFFEQEQDDGIKINKVFNAYDSYDVGQIEGDDEKKVNKKEKGLQSRDMMMDEDDQFTLSISDRDSANINEETNAKIVPDMNSLSRNKSAIMQSESSHDHQQTGNSLRRPKGNQAALNLYSNNFSAVYQGDLSRQKRKKFEESHKLSKEIAEKSKNSDSAQKLDEIMEENTIENRPSNIFDVGADIEEQVADANVVFFGTGENVQKKQQQAAPAQANAHDQQGFDDFQQGWKKNEQKNAQGLRKGPEDDQIEQIKTTGLKPSQSQAVMPSVRQIKVYKGKQIAQNEPEDIEQIDLTISKKQRELIELRKSIRKKQRERERSQDRKSRKNRSSSKDKRSKDATSQLGLMLPKSKDNMSSRGEQQPSSRLEIIEQHMQSSKLEVDERLIAPVTMSPPNKAKTKANQQTSGAIKEQIVSNNQKQTAKEQNLQSSIIMDEIKQAHIQNEPQIGSSEPIDQADGTRSAILHQNKPPNIQSFSNNFLGQNQPSSTILKPNGESGNLVSVKDNNRSEDMPKRNMKVSYQQIDKQLGSKYEISPRGEQYQYDIEEMNYDFVQHDSGEAKKQKNIFEYKKQDNSFFSEEPSEHQKQKLIGFISKPHKKIEAQNQPHRQSEDRRLQFNVVPDSENNPLDNKLKKISKQSIYSGNKSQKNDEDALDQMVDRTSRNQLSKNRSHLVRKNDDFQRQSSLDRKHNQPRPIPTQQSRVHQDLNDALTIRENSEKELTERRLMMNRPPMQHQRPATTEKNRMYIAGLKQAQGQEHVNTLRTSLDSNSLKNHINPPKTAYNMDFRGMKSRELQQQGDGRFDAYPSSLSSNRIQLGSEQLSNLPNKPLVSKTVRREWGEQHKQEQSSLNDSFARKSMKSYKSRSIDRNEYQQQNISNSRKKSINREENENDDLNEYYKRSRDSPSNVSRKSKSRSKSRQGNRSSDRGSRELQKIYLQRLQFKK